MFSSQAGRKSTTLIARTRVSEVGSLFSSIYHPQFIGRLGRKISVSRWLRLMANPLARRLPFTPLRHAIPQS